MLFFLIYQILADSFPSKPGFYGVMERDGKEEFIEIDISKHRLKNDDITAWNFSLVENSVAISTVHNQGACGGCWAFAAADVAGSSYFLNNKNGNVNIAMSAQYEIDCGGCLTEYDNEYCQNGCGGGYPGVALLEMINRGSVSSNCKPFKGSKGTCSSNCDDETPIDFYRDDKFAYYISVHQPISFVRQLVTSSGPCIAQMTTYEDLSNYTEGVYEVSSNPGEGGGHAINIYGFGSENEKNYWLLKNSWGEGFGIGGFLKIKMGTNESGIEDVIWCLYNNLDKGAYPDVPRPPQTLPGPGWNPAEPQPSDSSDNPGPEGLPAARPTPTFVKVAALIACVGPFVVVYAILLVRFIRRKMNNDPTGFFEASKDDAAPSPYANPTSFPSSSSASSSSAPYEG